MDEKKNRIAPAGPAAADHHRARLEAAFLQEGFDDLLRWVREAGRAMIGPEVPEVPARLEGSSSGASAGPLFVRESDGASVPCPPLDRAARLHLVAGPGVGRAVGRPRRA